MEVYKSKGHFPLFTLVYEKNSSTAKTLSLKSGPLEKWRFAILSRERFERSYNEYYKFKGNLPKEIKEEAIRAIFERGKW